MIVRRLEVRQLRRHQFFILEPADHITVIVGQNGVGKTTLLEAIDLAVSGTSFRSATTEQLVAHHATEARVTAEVVVPPSRTFDLAVVLQTGAARRAHLLNNKPIRRTNDLHRVIARTTFTSADLDLVKGSPSTRRAFLDDAVSQLTPRGSQVVDDYDRIVRQRNALLKQLKGRPNKEGWDTLDVWDERLCQVGADLVELRQEVLRTAQSSMAAAYDGIAGGDPDQLRATYVCKTDVALWSTEIQSSRQLDVLTGVTHIGPHRDDVNVSLGERNLRQLGSSGEQRSAVLAWKISTHRAVQETWGITPVLLLDDVFSELDEQRCRAVLQEFGVGQVIISAVALPPGTNADLVVHLEHDQPVAPL